MKKFPGLRITPSPLLSTNSDDIDAAGPFLRFGCCENHSETREDGGVVISDYGGVFKVSILVLTKQLKPSMMISTESESVYPNLVETNLAHSGFHAWIFNVEIPMQIGDQIINYKIRWSPSSPRTFTNIPFETHSIHVPGHHTSWHMAGFSCVGFVQSNSMEDQGVGTSSLFANIVDIHKTNPFHLLLGGGDQIYNDDVFQAVPALKEFEAFETHAQHWDMGFSDELRVAVEQFYAFNYIAHFSDRLLHTCLSKIPLVSAPDDHDFLDGLGSYPPEFENCVVMQRVKACGVKMFQMFQNHNATTLYPASPYGFCRLVKCSPRLSILAIDFTYNANKDSSPLQ
jgi:hypothetical protein